MCQRIVHPEMRIELPVEWDNALNTINSKTRIMIARYYHFKYLSTKVIFFYTTSTQEDEYGKTTTLFHEGE